MTVIDFSKPVRTTDTRIIATHKIQYYHPTLDPSHKVWDLTPLVQELRWSDDINQAAAQIDVRLAHHDSLKNLIRPGGIVSIFGKLLQPTGEVSDGEVIRGVIFKKPVNADVNSSQVSFTAYDHMIYLAKSEESEVFKNMTATEIITYIANKISLPLGRVASTSYKIPRLIFRKNTWYDMMIVALSESRWVDGERYILRMENGALNLIKKILPSKVWIFEYGKNIFDSSLTESIENMKNKIKVYSTQTADALSEVASSEIQDLQNDVLSIIAGGDDDPVEDAQKIADYGLLQHIETGTTPERFQDAKEYAQHLLETLSKVTIDGSVSLPNINNIRWGDAIYIYEPLTGMAAQYYVKASTHIVNPTGAYMELAIQFEDLLPEQLFNSIENAPSNAFDDILNAEGITRRIPQKYIDPITGESQSFTAPLNDPYSITQEYGSNKNVGYNGPNGHTGIDMANGSGKDAMDKPVYAVGPGTVIYAAYDKVGGNMIEIDHGNGLVTLYAHLDYMAVSPGKTVKRGDGIGLVGQSGSANPQVNPGGGPHLHFEVRRNGVTIDPREIVDIHY